MIRFCSRYGVLVRCRRHHAVEDVDVGGGSGDFGVISNTCSTVRGTR